MEKFIHAFNLVSGMGYLSLRKISNKFGSFQYAWDKAAIRDFIDAGLTEELAKNIVLTRNKIDADGEYKKLWEKDIFAFMPGNKEYPELLRQIENPPFLLYRKGAALKADDRFIAIVGTRVPSLYGEKSAYNISERIALYGGVIVSGLAFGIDAICHYAAVRNGKPTVAVLASPADKVTPSSHFNLSENILKTGGTIISEYAGDVTANKYRFLERNRLISGLCRATVIIEAAKKSGALITAAHASNQNRDVYALVGDITRPQAQGCLNLIEKNIACPVVSVDSLLRDLGFDPQKNKYAALTGPELKIIEFLKKSPLPADELCAKTKLKPQILNVMLTKLEIKNLIGKNEKMNWEIV